MSEFFDIFEESYCRSPVVWVVTIGVVIPARSLVRKNENMPSRLEKEWPRAVRYESAEERKLVVKNIEARI